MKGNLLNNTIRFIAILALLIYCSCSDVKIKDVTKKIAFEANCANISNDSLSSFYLQKIEIVNSERFSNIWIEGGMYVNIWIMIVNELQYDICIPTVHNSSLIGSSFVGITASDTIDFYYSLYEDEVIFVPSKDSLLIQLSCIGGAFDELFDYDNHGDNRKSMYRIIEKMCFYFMPIGYEEDSFFFNERKNIIVNKLTKVVTNSVVK